MNIGKYSEWYRMAEPGELEDLYGIESMYDEDVQEVLDSYGLDYVGWAIAKDKYVDMFADNNLDVCLVGQDPDTHEIGLYEWVGGRLYDAIDDVMNTLPQDDDMEDGMYESLGMHEALQEAFNLNESTLSNIKRRQAVWDWYKNHYEPYQIQDFIEFIQDEIDVSPDKFAKIIIDGLSEYEKDRILEFE